MSKKVDLHDVAQITVGNVLNNFSQSSKKLQELLAKALDKIEFGAFDKVTKTQIKHAMNELRKALAYLAGIDPEANEWLLSSMRMLRAQLKIPSEIEYIPYTLDCIENVDNALDNCIVKSFAVKARIQSFMMAHVATKGTELDWSSVVFPQAMKLVREFEEEEG